MNRINLLKPGLLIVAMMLFALTACNFPVASLPTSTSEPTFTMAPASPMPLATSTSTGTATVLPTGPNPTPLPSTSTQAAPTSPPVPTAFQGTSLSMQPGSTSVDVQSQVGNGGIANFLVRAGARQFMMAILSSANQSLALQVEAPDGSILVSAAQNLAFWQGALPLSGVYLISVVSKSGAATFDLNVTIPVRVSFASGATSASINGLVGSQQDNTYLLRALQGQTMTVTIKSPKNDIFLTIYGLEDGNPYVRSVTGQSTFTFMLPSTQDYVIQCVSTDNSAENYTVTFVVQ